MPPVISMFPLLAYKPFPSAPLPKTVSFPLFTAMLAAFTAIPLFAVIAICVLSPVKVSDLLAFIPAVAPFAVRIPVMIRSSSARITVSHSGVFGSLNVRVFVAGSYFAFPPSSRMSSLFALVTGVQQTASG